jgi:hypothetical protein
MPLPADIPEPVVGGELSGQAPEVTDDCRIT